MFTKVKRLYLKNKEAINYLIVGGLTTVISVGVYYICTLTFFNPNDNVQLQEANVISWICAVTFAYFTNRKYVFESKNKNKLAEISKFFIARLTTLGIDMLCMQIFVSVLRIDDKIAKLIVQFIVLVLNYVISKLFVFTKAKKQAKD